MYNVYKIRKTVWPQRRITFLFTEMKELFLPWVLIERAPYKCNKNISNYLLKVITEVSNSCHV